MLNQILEERLATIDSIPALPMVLRQIQKVMKNPSSNMLQIGLVVAKDQALASRTIRLVNSVFYGMRTPVTSITQAIVILGLNTLNNIMLGLTVIKMFKLSKQHGFDSEKFWEHCFGTALIAKKIGEIIIYPDPNECFTAGLLHDMGRMVLDQFFQEEFARALQVAEQEACPLYMAEKKVLGFSHDEAGAWLANKWDIPPVFIAPCQYHHVPEMVAPEHIAQQQMITIIAAANSLCTQNKIGSSGNTIITNDYTAAIPGLTKEIGEKIAHQSLLEVKSTFEEWNK